MSKEIENFIKENTDLIQDQKWEEIYRKELPKGFTETLLDCGINPLEQGLSYIPDYFLHNCKSIEEFTIPDSVTSIGNSAFYDCYSLTKIILPKNLKFLDAYVFQMCEKLNELHYSGSKMDFKSILNNSSDYWNWASNIEKIICTDGEIIL